jgi:hypothetical protein
MENLGIYFDHLVCLTAIGNILWPFGIYCGHLVNFPRFGMLYLEKSGNPGSEIEMNSKFQISKMQFCAFLLFSEPCGG